MPKEYQPQSLYIPLAVLYLCQNKSEVGSGGGEGGHFTVQNVNIPVMTSTPYPRSNAVMFWPRSKAASRQSRFMLHSERYSSFGALGAFRFIQGCVSSSFIKGQNILSK